MKRKKMKCDICEQVILKRQSIEGDYKGWSHFKCWDNLNKALAKERENNWIEFYNLVYNRNYNRNDLLIFIKQKLKEKGE